MEFGDFYLQRNMENTRETEANKDVSDLDVFCLELGFVERYEDADGIVHLKTSLGHEDMDDGDLWEVFDTKDGSMPLELLVYDGI